MLHSRINYTYRRMQEYLHSTKDLGSAARRRALGAAGRLFLGRVRPARIGADLFRRPGHPGRRPHQERSDLGIPLVGVGLYYDQGYFSQRLDIEGWQQEDYIDVDSRDAARCSRRSATDGQPVTVQHSKRAPAEIIARVWKVAVGRNTLLLLDSDVEGNQPEDRELTARLYGGDNRLRIRQELLLGVGGVRALQALGISPGVVHLNEGHSAFAALELVRQRMTEEGLRVEEAMRRVASQTVFTTHTPVPAGHDRFSARPDRRASWARCATRWAWPTTI